MFQKSSYKNRPIHYIGAYKKSIKLLYSIMNLNTTTRGVTLPFTLKSILRQKKNYGNSNIPPFKNLIFKNTILSKKPKSFKIL
jgi:hypothetical protein